MNTRRCILHAVACYHTPPPAVNNQAPVALSAQMFYNAPAPFGDVIGREVKSMDFLDFLKAVGASVVGNCVYKIAAYVVKLIRDRL